MQKPLSRTNWTASKRLLLGWGNLLLAVVGLGHTVFTGVGYHFLPPEFIARYGPFMEDHSGFIRMQYLSVMLLVPLGLLGLLILFGNQSALVGCRVLFVVEIASFVTVLWNWSLGLSPLAMPVIATGLMNVGIALQIITIYPVIWLVVLANEEPGHWL